MDVTAAPARVLVVEDDAGVASLFARILSGAGYVVEAAPDFGTARALLECQPPDVFLLDVMLPGTDGFSICKWLKDNATTRLTPVILVTALGDRESRIAGRRAGADDYLQKPVDPHELIARVASAARLKRYTDDLDSATSIVMTLAVMIEAAHERPRARRDGLRDERV
jgi:DNA-binding response OmpR family regulator